MYIIIPINTFPYFQQSNHTNSYSISKQIHILKDDHIQNIFEFIINEHSCEKSYTNAQTKL
jgi:hypothetical protein